MPETLLNGVADTLGGEGGRGSDGGGDGGEGDGGGGVGWGEAEYDEPGPDERQARAQQNMPIQI